MPGPRGCSAPWLCSCSHRCPVWEETWLLGFRLSRFTVQPWGEEAGSEIRCANQRHVVPLCRSELRKATKVIWSIHPSTRLRKKEVRTAGSRRQTLKVQAGRAYPSRSIGICPSSPCWHKGCGRDCPQTPTHALAPARPTAKP